MDTLEQVNFNKKTLKFYNYIYFLIILNERKRGKYRYSN